MNSRPVFPGDHRIQQMFPTAFLPVIKTCIINVALTREKDLDNGSNFSKYFISFEEMLEFTERISF